MTDLLARLPGGAPPGMAAALHNAAWLFPGRRPGQHMHPTSLANRLRRIDVEPRTDRNGTLLDLAAHSRPRSSAD